MYIRKMEGVLSDSACPQLFTSLSMLKTTSMLYCQHLISRSWKTKCYTSFSELNYDKYVILDGSEP